MEFGTRVSGTKKNEWLKDLGYELGKVMLNDKQISAYMVWICFQLR